MVPRPGPNWDPPGATSPGAILPLASVPFSHRLELTITAENPQRTVCNCPKSPKQRTHKPCVGRARLPSRGDCLQADPRLSATGYLGWSLLGPPRRSSSPSQGILDWPPCLPAPSSFRRLQDSRLSCRKPSCSWSLRLARVREGALLIMSVQDCRAMGNAMITCWGWGQRWQMSNLK